MLVAEVCCFQSTNTAMVDAAGPNRCEAPMPLDILNSQSLQSGDMTLKLDRTLKLVKLQFFCIAWRFTRALTKLSQVRCQEIINVVEEWLCTKELSYNKDQGMCELRMMMMKSSM